MSVHVSSEYTSKKMENGGHWRPTILNFTAVTCAGWASSNSITYIELFIAWERELSGDYTQFFARWRHYSLQELAVQKLGGYYYRLEPCPYYEPQPHPLRLTNHPCISLQFHPRINLLLQLSLFHLLLTLFGVILLTVLISSIL